MSICHHPHAFDAGRFAAELAAADCATTLDVVMVLMDCALDEPDFDWSLDGTEDGNIISGRVNPLQWIGSIVDNVRLGLRTDGTAPGHVEASTLLGHVSVADGRLIEEEPFVGYLMPDEIRRASELLADIALDDAGSGSDSDRLLLLRLFATALESERGLYWLQL